MAEKRHNTRRRCDRSAEIVVDQSSHRGQMHNISIEGAYLKTKEAFEIGKEVTISYRHSADSSQIMVKGRIVRVDNEGIAIKFSL